MRWRWIIALAIAVLAAAGAGTSVWLRSRAVETKKLAVRNPSPAFVDISLPARLQAETLVNVPVPVPGKIEVFHVEIGAEVYAGQLLAQIRSEGLEGARQAAALDVENARSKVTNLEAEITAARLEASRAAADASRSRSEYDRASRNLERQKILIAEGATPRNTFENAQKEHAKAEIESKNLAAVAQQAEARVATLQRDLDITRRLLEQKEADLESADSRIASGDVHSPVDGVVAGRRGEPGEHVDPNTKDLFEIAIDLSSMQAVAEAEPSLLAQIRPGQDAAVVIAEAANEIYPGAVKSVSNNTVIVRFANPNPLIRPGLSAQIRIRVPE